MADHASIVEGAGWPNVFLLATEITAIRGWTATTNDAIVSEPEKPQQPQNVRTCVG